MFPLIASQISWCPLSRPILLRQNIIIKTHIFKRNRISLKKCSCLQNNHSYLHYMLFAYLQCFYNAVEAISNLQGCPSRYPLMTHTVWMNERYSWSQKDQRLLQSFGGMFYDVFFSITSKSVAILFAYPECLSENCTSTGDQQRKELNL